MPIPPGTRVGPYEILAPIGAGGMGEVYRATDTRLQRDVAIKFSGERFSDRFEQEARAVAALNHPNICTLHDVGANHLVMEFIEGPTLADRLAQGPLPLNEALAIAQQVAEALEAAHENGVVHRDLKPANIKVKPDGTVKVLDFGLAKAGKPAVASSTDSPTIALTATQPGLIMGTAAYMSPEQAVGKPVDKRADIWSFGVVLWEMLSGKPLFTGETAGHTLAEVIRGDIDFAKLPNATPAAIRQLIERCLDRDVKTRLRDVGEARVAIRKYLANPSAAITQAPRRSATLPWAVAAAAGIAAVALGYIAHRHSREEAPPLTRLYLPPPEPGAFSSTSGVSLAVSPDGRRIVFSAVVEGKGGLWLRDLSSSTSQLLATGVQRPFWSPDGRHIAFFTYDKLMKVPLNGGQAQVICNVTAPISGAWGPGDVILFSKPGGGILRVSANGGIPVQITELDTSQNEDSHRYPWFLPDGRHFLYTARTAQRTTSTVYLGDLQSKEKRAIVKAASNAVYTEPGYLLFTRNRTVVAQPFSASKLQTTGDAVPVAENITYGVSENAGNFAASGAVLTYTSDSSLGSYQLTWFDRAGKPLGKVGPPGELEMISLSPDGNAVVTVRNDPQTGAFDLWEHNLARGTDTRLTFTGSSRFPVWSPDGARVAFDGTRGGPRKLYVKAANGIGREEVLESAHGLPAAWSRDGRYLVTMTPSNNPETGNDIWVLPLFGERKPFPYIATEFAEFFPRLSPDGRWLAYQSNESGRVQVYVVSFPSASGRWQVSVDGGTLPVWSRDGKELFFHANDKMMAADIKPGATFHAGIPKPLFEVRAPGRNMTFEVSDDGRFLIPVTPGESTAPLSVVLNWHEALLSQR